MRQQRDIDLVYKWFKTDKKKSQKHRLGPKPAKAPNKTVKLWNNSKEDGLDEGTKYI